MPAASRLPQVGDQFGRYRVDAQIGRGGMGVVFRATDTAIDRVVALKVVSSGLGDSEEFRRRFEREAAVLARLDSPHVIAIYDYGTHDDCPYIATQHVGGGDLGALLHARGAMPPALALRVCAQLADALHDAHRVGVVHRDVKPSNVLLRDADSLDLHAYLCDFGIARTATESGDGLTAPGAVAGTWSYLAPECGRGEPGTPASDVYALGCLLWATLSGTPPYRGADVEVAVAHQRAPIPQLAGGDELAVRVNAVLRRAMAKAPADRYDDADALRADLLAAAAVASATSMRPLTGVGHPSQQRHPSLAPTALPGAPSTPPPRTPTPAPSYSRSPGRRRRSWVAIALAGAAVLAVVGGGVALAALTRDDEPDPTAAPTSSSSAPTPVTETVTPSPSPTTPAPTPTPVRVDDGGPITGDLDGDGLGDLRIQYSLSSRSTDTSGNFSDVTDWTSDGTTFVRGPTARDVTSSERFDQHVTGDFDGDDVLETLVARTVEARNGTMKLLGTMSGGARMDASFPRLPLSTFPAAGDVDGDGRDDLRLLYVDDINQPSQVASVILDGTRTRDTRLLTTSFPSFGGSSYTAGDYDGDGLEDLAVLQQIKDGAEDDVSNYHTELTLWFGDETGGLTEGPRERVRTYGYLTVLLSADLDGDEDDELVVLASEDVGEIVGYDVRGRELRRPNPLGVFRSLGQDFTASISDVDGDGRDDVVALVVVSDERARIVVGRSDGKSVRVSAWARWDRRFDSAKVSTFLSTVGGSFT